MEWTKNERSRAMRSISCHHVLLAITLGLVVSANLSFAVSMAHAMWPTKIRVTDIKGFNHVLSDFDLEHSDSHRMGSFGIGIVLVSSPPARHVWVQYSQISKLTLQSASRGIQASVMLADGSVLEGILDDTAAKILGKSDLGKTTLRVADIKTVEFVEFIEYKYASKPAVRRDAAAESWQKNWMIGSEERILVDEDRSTVVISPEIMDSYTTNRDGLIIWFGKSIRVSRKQAGFTVERGVSQTEVSFKDWDVIELILSSNNSPEAVLSKSDGKRVPAKMLMLTKEEYSSDNNSKKTFGAAEPDDMIIWRTPYGYEGVSLLPARKIRLERKK